ncbi:MAG: HAMP domain-containing histidine kinase [Planctomycetes bacterium]|nr:HAMP domain-containing histidine kinase [Planctomycetota bacterium]
MTAFVYQLPLEKETKLPEEVFDSELSLSVGPLIRNVIWFARLRFAVVAILLSVGLAGLLGHEYFENLGLLLPRWWPIWMGVILCALNTGFVLYTRRMARTQSNHLIRMGFGSQIVIDLIFLTAIVHFLGSTNTFASFAYLFHIVLASIFYSRQNSLWITLFACALFVGCVVAESTGIVAPARVFAPGTILHSEQLSLVPLTLHVASAVVVWIVAWYLVSRQTSFAKQRDAALAAINKRLVEAGRERSAHMLRTTHEIKAPFAAIHANTQILLKGRCGELPDAARNIVERIEQRCRKLSEEIKQMLQVANLQSRGQQTPVPEVIDLRDCLSQCLATAKDMAVEHGVTLVTDLHSVSVVSVQDHLHMMFENIISNGIAYSHEGGTVKVACGLNGDQGAEVSVEDQGIGIPEEKASKVFQDYYRTQEAVKHNKSSTGLGLAVVRRIAKKHRLRIQVETELGRGTTFRIEFPKTEIVNQLSK